LNAGQWAAEWIGCPFSCRQPADQPPTKRKEGDSMETMTNLGRYFKAVWEDGDYLNDWITHLPGWLQDGVAVIGQILSLFTN